MDEKTPVEKLREFLEKEQIDIRIVPYLSPTHDGAFVIRADKIDVIPRKSN